MRSSTRLLLYNKAKAAGVIETGVAPLVESLNKTGVCQTIASCHGHIKSASIFRGKNIDRYPYVLFRMDVELARSIAKYLDFGHGLNNELYYCWKLESYFYPGDWDLVWNLNLSDNRLPNEWDRIRIDNDLKTLSLILPKLLIKL